MPHVKIMNVFERLMRDSNNAIHYEIEKKVNKDGEIEDVSAVYTLIVDSAIPISEEEYKAICILMNQDK